MSIKSYLSKQFTTKRRDWIIATGQAAATAAGTFLLDQLSLAGLKFDFKQILTASGVVFAQHIIRKLIEPNKIITMQEVDKEKLPIAKDIVEEANEQGVSPQNLEVLGDPPPKQQRSYTST